MWQEESFDLDSALQR